MDRIKRAVGCSATVATVVVSMLALGCRAIPHAPGLPDLNYGGPDELLLVGSTEPVQVVWETETAQLRFGLTAYKDMLLDRFPVPFSGVPPIFLLWLEGEARVSREIMLSDRWQANGFLRQVASHLLLSGEARVTHQATQQEVQAVRLQQEPARSRHTEGIFRRFYFGNGELILASVHWE